MIHRCAVWVAAVGLCVSLGAPLWAGEAKGAPPPPAKKAPDKKGAEKEKQPPKPPEPLHVWAERIHYIQGQNLANITGPATIIKGDMRIDAANVVAHLDEKTGEFKKMDATGDVRVYTIVPITQRTKDRPPLQLAPEGRSATCDRATYDEATGIVVLYGTPEAQPVVRLNKDEARADLITYDRNKNTITLEGNVLFRAMLPVKREEKAPPDKGEPPKAAPPKETPPAK